MSSNSFKWCNSDRYNFKTKSSWGDISYVTRKNIDLMFKRCSDLHGDRVGQSEDNFEVAGVKYMAYIDVPCLSNRISKEKVIILSFVPNDDRYSDSVNFIRTYVFAKPEELPGSDIALQSFFRERLSNLIIKFTKELESVLFMMEQE